MLREDYISGSEEHYYFVFYGLVFGGGIHITALGESLLAAPCVSWRKTTLTGDYVKYF